MRKDRTNEVLEIFLVENKIVNEADFQYLKEEVKTSTVREIILKILTTITEKVESLDTNFADRSRGDIKQLKELDDLQVAVTKLENMIERAGEIVTPDLNNYLKEIVKSILYLNQYAPEFKVAYREKKTLLILKYQSLIMSVFSAVSYLLSVMIDFSTGEPKLHENPKYELIAPIKTLMDFNRSVEGGNFKLMLRDVQTLRESFLEIPQDKLDVILESPEIMAMVLNGLSAISSQIDTKAVINVLYKAAGIIALVMSLREVLYAFFRSRTKFADILNAVQSFAGTRSLGSSEVAKMNSFSDKYHVDAEESTKLAQRDIETENKEISSFVKTSSSRTFDAPKSTDTNFDLGF
jgi:hypothetical protein